MNDSLRPDRTEEELGDALDDMVPTRGYSEVPVVGIGGSAGSVEALQAFFTAMPANAGLAVVVVTHLPPEHDSMLAAILQRCTRMPVQCVEDGMPVEVGHVYVIPSGKLLECTDGHLRLQDPPEARSRHVSVDIFFRSLADTHGPHAAAVVLSGMDGDGAIGVKRIKERGGLAIAQDPQEASQEGMPRAAMATNMVDWVLPVREMPGRLLSYFRLEQALVLPAEEPKAAREEAEADHEDQLAKVLQFVRSRSGRNFALYKRGTVLRRLARRMQLNGIDNLRAYLNCLQTRPGETAALVQDLLISVTNFFRDVASFDALEMQMPALFQGKGPDSVVRVWVVACATGEEAYSIAMLLSEYASRLEAPPAIQVFATDLDEEAIRTAREGIYPQAIAADVSEARLRRFFHQDVRGYRVRRELREVVLFAVHDVLTDPPFSHVDLVSCRNLLIYLKSEAQERVLETLNFALNARGRLLLGSAESVEDGSLMFEAVDKRHRLYRQLPAARSLAPAPRKLLTAIEDRIEIDQGWPGRSRAGLAAMPASPLPAFQAPAGLPGISWREVHLQLIEHLAPPSVLVDSNYDLLHVSPGAARFLQFPAGEPTRSFLRTTPQGAQLQLRAAFGQAAQTGASVTLPGVALDGSSRDQPARVRIVPLQQPEGPLFLVTLETAALAEESNPDGQADGAGVDPLAAHLGLEMGSLQHQLRETAEQYEASAEELKASNEELQSMYEEMRAQSEELETGKEELQSVNEELSVVNGQLKAKVNELTQANSDMQNLIDATAIATVFLDRELRITRYTPTAVRLFNLIPGDVGRPLTDMATRLDYPQLGEDARAVLDGLVPVEREIGLGGDSWYLARIMPYRTAEDRIAGVVFTFVDISQRRRAEEARLWLSAVVTSTPDAVIAFGLDQTILTWNNGAERMLGYTAKEVIGQSMHLLGPAHEQEQERIAADVTRGRTIVGMETVRRRKDGRDVHVSLTAAPIRLDNGYGPSSGNGAATAVSMIMRDVSAARAAAEALRQGEERLRMLVENIVEYAIFSTDLQRRITIWNSGAQRFLGYAEAEALGQSADMIFTPEDRAAGAPEAEAQMALREGRSADERMHLRKDGSRFPGIGVMMLMRNAQGEAVGFVKILRDGAEQLPPAPS